VSLTDAACGVLSRPALFTASFTELPLVRLRSETPVDSG
jgi:hypothetical protein